MRISEHEQVIARAFRLALAFEPELHVTTRQGVGTLRVVDLVEHGMRRSAQPREAACIWLGPPLADDHADVRFTTVDGEIGGNVYLRSHGNSCRFTLPTRLSIRQAMPLAVDDSCQQAAVLNVETATGDELILSLVEVGWDCLKVQVPADVNLAVGDTLALREPALPLQVVAVSGNGADLRPRPLDGKQLVAWFDWATASLSTDMRTYVPDYVRLYACFLEAGAFSAPRIRDDRHRVAALLAGPAHDDTGGLAFRWVNLHADSDVVGHAGMVRIADSTWLAGDLVGGAEPSSKSGFGYDFWCASHTALELLPSPQTSLTCWVRGHCYWRAVEVALRDSAFVMAHAATVYTRCTVEDNISVRAEAQASSRLASWRHVDAGIDGNLVATLPPWLRPFAEALDISSDRLGSTKLLQVAKEAGIRVVCETVLVVVGQHRFLVKLTDFPMQLNFSRVACAAWVLPVDEAPLDRATRTNATAAILDAADQLGFEPNAIRRFVPADSGELLGAEGVILDAWLTSPRFWTSFRRPTAKGVP